MSTERKTRIELDDIIFQGQTRHIQLPVRPIGTFVSGDTTPSVAHGHVFKCAGSSVNITNFDDGQEGQVIKIRGDGMASVISGTYIKTSTGGSHTLFGNYIYTFTYIDGAWYEDA